MIGEKKSDIFELIPDDFIPTTILIGRGDLERAALEAEKMGFPIIAKPNVGERGIFVAKINSQEELKAYVQRYPVAFLLQEIVNYPIELGVFYVKLPSEEGRITSIVRKEFLSVTGDGTSTVRQLLAANTRAQINADLESDLLKKIGDNILEKGEQITIEPIGNHSRGTKFLNDNHEIDEALNSAFQTLANQIPEFYFGRFDLKCESYDDLKKLENFKILELNGAGAEPAHIYQPGFPLWRAYKDILWHLSALSKISLHNYNAGHQYWNFSRGLRKWNEHKKHTQLLSKS